MSDAGSGDSGGGAATSVAVLTHIARSIVDDPESVSVTSRGSGSRVGLELAVAPGDMGRVIGRRGRVAQAIRSVVRAVGTTEGAEVDVSFVD